jgi:hypothetical protein
MNYRINFKAVTTAEDLIRVFSVLFGNQVITIPNDFYEVLDKEGLTQYFTVIPEKKNESTQE